ncbi:MAG: Sensor kinase CusS [Verrucomicrobiales bacterium]|nr:Sensor kinase CusS [Verrucomicrobiales bacterium]
MFTHSIRWRLQLWLAFLLVCVLSGFGLTVYQLQRITQLNQLDEALKRRVAALNLTVRGGPMMEFFRRSDTDKGPGPRDFPSGGFNSGSRERPYGPPHGPGFMPGEKREVRLSPETAALFSGSQPGAFYFSVWSRDSNLLARAAGGPTNVSLPPRMGRDTSLHAGIRGKNREAYQFTELGDCILVGRSLIPDWDAESRLAWMLLAAGGGVLALGLSGGWLLTTRAIRPVEEISAAASRISAGNLSERITTSEPNNELGRLAGILNNTFSRLETVFNQQKQFTADAAHELRTPISVLISEAQVMLSRERTPSEYKESLETCLDTAQQLRRLTDSLLELARTESNQFDSDRSRVDVSEVARDCVERLKPLAAERNVVLKTELNPGEVIINSDRLVQILINLLSNGIHYNKPGGEVLVKTVNETGKISIIVQDTGIGIPEEDLPRIFDRFYRADKSRSRAEGRAGLGLAICKAIVEADGGELSVESKLNVGTTFKVLFPGAAPRARNIQVAP